MRVNKGPNGKPWKRAATRVFWLWINPIDYTAEIWVVTQLLLLCDINKKLRRGGWKDGEKRINAAAHEVIKRSDGRALKALLEALGKITMITQTAPATQAFVFWE